MNIDNEVLAQLKALEQRDIETRTRLLQAGQLYDAYDDAMQRIHIANARALDDLIARHGWPGISKVGIEGCRAAWLIAQHAICTPTLQRGFLQSLKAAVGAGEAPARQLAMLTDRICYNEGRPQVYGTVLGWQSDGELGCDLQDRENVDERRAAVGLPPFAESLQAHRREVEAEGGKAPENFAAWQQAADEWARRVGWR